MDRRTLRYAIPLMSGDDVLELQRNLSMRALCTGNFDLITERTVARFQELHGLKVDGICGPKTWEMIDKINASMSKRATYACTTTAETLVIDDNAALWMMRMVVGEGGAKCSARKTAALLWAIVNRWFLWPGSRHYSDFVAMLRAFSQPINPRWMTGGDKLEEYHHKGPASPARVVRREEICAMLLGDIPTAIRDNVELFASGKLPYPDLTIEKRRISNWASLKSTPIKYPWGMDIGGDWFFEDGNLRSGEVVVE